MDEEAPAPASEVQLWFAEKLIPAAFAFWQGMQEKQKARTLTDEEVHTMLMLSPREAAEEAEKFAQDRINALAAIKDEVDAATEADARNP